VQELSNERTIKGTTMDRSDNRVEIDEKNVLFARVMKICSLVGLVVMIVFGLLYIAGVSSYLDVSRAYLHWDKPVSLFWKEITGSEVSDYSWFLSTIGHMDSLSMLGIALLAVTPLIGILFIILRSSRIYVILLSILVVEFFYSIVRPFI